jgi:hypothetical protein
MVCICHTNNKPLTQSPLDRKPPSTATTVVAATAAVIAFMVFVRLNLSM